MKIIKDKSFLDNICFRCRKSTPKHDYKLSIRTGSFIENIRMNLVTIYFLLFDCFIINLISNKAAIEYNKLNEELKIGNVSIQNIQKFFRIVRNKIKVNTHKEWKQKLLGDEPSTGGVLRIEIDKSKIIGNANTVYYMFGMIDRADKNCRVFCVKDNRSRESLLPIITKNISTVMDIKDNNYNSVEEIHNKCLSTRIYSDCWGAYQYSDFKNLGYLFHRVNHSIWFGRGHFHTNTIEGLWSKIKRLSNNFAGLNFALLNTIEKLGINAQDYLNDWICTSLYFGNCERLKLNKLEKLKLLLNYLEI